jgi:hypothetical protein
MIDLMRFDRVQLPEQSEDTELIGIFDSRTRNTAHLIGSACEELSTT